MIIVSQIAMNSENEKKKKKRRRRMEEEELNEEDLFCFYQKMHLRLGGRRKIIKYEQELHSLHF